MKNFGLVSLVFIATFQVLGASMPAPIQNPTLATPKKGTLVGPSETRAKKTVYSHRRISSIGMGVAFTNTIKKILKDNKEQVQFKVGRERDVLTPLNSYLQIAQENIINSSDEQDNTALHLAAFDGGKAGKAIVEYLLAKSSILINKKNIHGFTPLIESIRASRYEIFKLLIVRDEAIIATPDEHEKTVVDYIKDLPDNDVNKAKIFKEFQEITAKKLARASVPMVVKGQLKTHLRSASNFDDGADVLGGEPSDACGGCCGFLFLKTK